MFLKRLFPWNTVMWRSRSQKWQELRNSSLLATYTDVLCVPNWPSAEPGRRLRETTSKIKKTQWVQQPGPFHTFASLPSHRPEINFEVTWSWFSSYWQPLQQAHAQIIPVVHISKLIRGKKRDKIKPAEKQRGAGELRFFAKWTSW